MTLGDALAALEKDPVIRSAMPGEMYRLYDEYKRDEWERFLHTTTEWDIKTYLDCLPWRQAPSRGHHMCGIAGLIHRDGVTNVGREMTAMLKSLKHRGPDSTGFAIYGASVPNEYVMRLKLAEQEDMTQGPPHPPKIRAPGRGRRRLAELGAETVEIAEATPYAFRYRLRYAGDTRKLTEIEQIEGAEVLSFGSALELIKDLGDASVVSSNTGSAASAARTASAHAHGDGIRRRYSLGPSLLGLSL